MCLKSGKNKYEHDCVCVCFILLFRFNIFFLHLVSIPMCVLYFILHSIWEFIQWEQKGRERRMLECTCRHTSHRNIIVIMKKKKSDRIILILYIHADCYFPNRQHNYLYFLLFFLFSMRIWRLIFTRDKRRIFRLQTIFFWFALLKLKKRSTIFRRIRSLITFLATVSIGYSIRTYEE